MEITNIRNFAIIAHIDHGKSTLADRFIQLCGGEVAGHIEERVLDTMDIERERGITIKSQAVSLNYKSQSGKVFLFNIIDTPGHVDFSYEVDRSLASCDGALLLVDATQGVEAQSIANCHVAVDNGLKVISVLNKVDLSSADTDKACEQIEEFVGIDASDAKCISAKTGQGVRALMEAVTVDIPAPKGSENLPLKAIIMDSWFDSYAGVVLLVRVFDGVLRRRCKLKAMSNGFERQVEEVGIFTPKRTHTGVLRAGEIGYVITGIKDIRIFRVGDTVTDAKCPSEYALPGFKKIQSKVFSGLFPTNADQYLNLQAALDKLALNDASLAYAPESSRALGLGFRCGFLGTLHMEVIVERLEREYGLNLISTAPSVTYRVSTTDGSVKNIDNPSDLPTSNNIKTIEEPMIRATILTPLEYMGGVIKLCIGKRGMQTKMRLTAKQAVLEYLLPLNEIVFNFFNALKSVSRGYASFDYVLDSYLPSRMTRLDILINGEAVDSLSIIVFQDHAYAIGREWIDKLCSIVPRQMFEVAIQAAIGAKIIARGTVKALRKHVTAKCYGGDVTRKRKLLEKQKAGKKRMKSVGRVVLPKEAFLSVLNLRHRPKR